MTIGNEVKYIRPYLLLFILGPYSRPNHYIKQGMFASIGNIG